MSSIAAVAVIGSGPYGLSIAAHLAGKGLRPLVFGRPMETWREAMPHGMRLKSEGFASSLSDPTGAATLAHFCAAKGLVYADLDEPVPVETFAAYGVDFQRRLVPQVDERLVRCIRTAPHGFELELEDGMRVSVRRVVVATGIRAYRQVPPVFADLSPDRFSHTADRADYTPFRGRQVVVVGAGASAIDAAAALHRAGAGVRLVSRRAAITFHAARRRTLWQRLSQPTTPLGPGWKKLLCVKAPLVFRALPARWRLALVRRYLGPSPGWSARVDVEDKAEAILSATVTRAADTPRGVTLEVATPHGPRVLAPADHVILGTGYRVNLRALPFLDAALLARIDLLDDTPRLSASFETSLPGLYFAGTAASSTFGPMLRFVCGAEFTARRIARHVAAAETRANRRAASTVAASRQTAGARGVARALLPSLRR